eukprot:1837506-Heterocapsa_arctica.AAC.1
MPCTSSGMACGMMYPAMYWKSPNMKHTWVFLDDWTLNSPALPTQGVLRQWAEMAHASLPPMAERAALT